MVVLVLVLVVVVDAGGGGGLDPPRSASTWSRKPELAQVWDISQIMTPPKLEKPLT